MILITAVLASLLALALVAVAWHRVRLARRLRRYDARWEALKEQSHSDDPIMRRAAAKGALRLLKQGPMEQKRRLD